MPSPAAKPVKRRRALKPPHLLQVKDNLEGGELDPKKVAHELMFLLGHELVARLDAQRGAS